MVLVQTLPAPVQGYWDGGPKQVFEWRIEPVLGGCDERGLFCRIGCFAANHWFHVALSRTEKMTLGNAKRRLRRFAPTGTTFAYKED